MKILIVADIHSNLPTLDKILSISQNENPDLVICPGNFTDVFLVSDFPQLDLAEIITQKLLSLNKPLFCVPGNHDPPEILDVFRDYNCNLHNQLKPFQNFDFLGFGGAQTPFNTPFEPSEEETSKSLEALFQKSQSPNKILVAHNPPKDTPLDKIKSGQHVGSPSIRNLILSQKPLLSISAHIHEGKGQYILGTTTLFNPGPAFLGNYGLVSIEKSKITCFLKNVNPPQKINHSKPAKNQKTNPRKK